MAARNSVDIDESFDYESCESASAGSDSVCFSGATLAVASNTITPWFRMTTEIPLGWGFILRVALS